MDANIKIIEYFRSNIFEAESSYNAWKMLAYAKSINVVGKELAEKYTKIQNYHSSFFVTVERSLLITWVMLVCHAFDKDNRSYSLTKIDPVSCGQFLTNNENHSVIEQLQTARNKLFAHKESGVSPNEITIPSVEKMDSFFNRLEALYNQLSKPVDGSFTAFDFTEDIKHTTEILYMNLERGETMRLKEIDIEWMWEKDDNKASKKV